MTSPTDTPQDAPQDTSPDNTASVDARISEGLNQHSRGNLAQAEQLYRAVLGQNPHHAVALHYLGVIALQTNNPDQAIELIQQSITQSPDYADAYSNLGNAYQASGKFNEAVECLEKALQLTDTTTPNAEVLANLGNAYAQLSKFDSAAANYEKAITIGREQKRELPEVHRNLANARLALGLPAKALASITEANRLQPGNIAIQLSLANILPETGRQEEAIECYREILKRHGNSPQVHTNLANVLRHTGELSEAFIHYNKAIELDAEFDEAFYNRAVAHMDNGNLAEAREDAHRAIELNPAYGKAHGLIASLDNAAPGSTASLSVLQEAFARKGLPPEQKMHLAFALGKSLEGLEEYDKAFAYYRLANTLRRKAIHYDEVEESKFFTNLKQTITPTVIQNLSRSESKDRDETSPVFILGMPRSGTTLVEQILASHPEIHAAGELSYFPQGISKEFATPNGIDYTEDLGNATPSSIKRIADSYLAKLDGLAPDGKIVTDKLPMNFFHIGLIKMAFPDATVIHCQRNPLDTCLSIYKNFFSAQGHNYSYDLAELGRFYALYQDLMNHWRETLPGFMFEISYERLVSNQEEESRKLIDACGLDWHPDCLEFHETKRQVLTLSATQVRQPMYNKSVEFWRNYETGLAPIIEILGNGTS